jgi:septum formation protein
MLILASASPRRRELLTLSGFHFEVHAADVVEELISGEHPITAAIRLATIKAQAVQALSPDAVVLGADTVVVSPQGIILGKPRDAAHAAEMLRMLSGATHQVITGVCIAWAGRLEAAAEVTSVTMRAPSDTEIEAYIATGEPMDKAGAYAIQGRAARWIPRIHGDYSNVVGLPLALVTAMLEAAAVYPR